jgi:hypothetical protein
MLPSLSSKAIQSRQLLFMVRHQCTCAYLSMLTASYIESCRLRSLRDATTCLPCKLLFAKSQPF